MPLHDWSRVESGIFHAFHTTWISEIQNELNRQLPGRYYALAEQHAGGFIADVLTLQSPGEQNGTNGVDDEPTGKQIDPEDAAGTAVANRAPAVAVQEKIDADVKDLQRTLTIRHVSNHRIVALLEVVSPANKDREQRVNEFVLKNVDAIQRGIHVLIIDLFAASSHDPYGIHPLIRSRLQSVGESVSPRATLASYAAGEPINAYLEFPADDEPLKKMPIFLTSDRYIDVDLEETYKRAWSGMPEFWKRVLLGE